MLSLSKHEAGADNAIIEETGLIPEFAPEDLALAEAVRKFAAQRLAPRAAALDDGGSVVEHLPALSEQGLLGMNLPESWGSGIDWRR